MTGTVLGHYRVLWKLGAGGMGEVYRARDTQLKRDVALKVLPTEFALDPERLARFDREAQALAALNHPHIAQVHGIATDGGVHAIVMELVEGRTLAERLTQGPVPLEEALPLARQLAEALEYAHERGVVHRDLKPANIKITPDGELKVLDFGLAKVLTEDASGAGADVLGNSPTVTSPARVGYRAGATQAGVILGTAAYMAPEQARGAVVDKRADIWAFGVVLFEMLTGKPCFPGETVTDVLAAVMKGEPDWAALPAATPPRLRELLERCLTKDRKQRLRDIGDARIDFDDAARASREHRPEGGATGATPRRVSIRQRIPWVLFVAMAVASAYLAWMGYQKPAGDGRPIVSNLVPPAGAVSCFRDGFAVSPDGRKIAFSSLSAAGERLLWVRDLGEAESVALPKTDGAVYPFWSPSGRDIGFRANGRLKRVPATGGPVTELCDASSWGGPSAWTDHGVIVFTYGSQGLLSVSENGGTATPLIKIQTDFLAALKGGLLAFSMERNSTMVAAVAPIVQPEARKVIEGMTFVKQLQPAGNEWFWYWRGDTRALVAQQADVGAARTTGPVKIVADRVPEPNGFPAFSVSPSLAAFVVNPKEARNDYASRLTWVARDGTVLSHLGETGGYWSVRLSHDGRQIAATPDDDIWLFDSGTGRGVRFTLEADENRQASWPVWSPRDDQLVAHVNSVIFGLDVRRYSVSAPSLTPKIVLDATEWRYATDWSRDGRFLAVTRNMTSNADLGYYDWNEERLHTFLATPAYEDSSVFSPDGRWVAYVSNKSGRLEVYTQAFPEGGQETRVTEDGGAHPRWRADGKELFFLQPDGSVMAAPVQYSPSFDVGTATRLFRMAMVDILHGLVAPYDVAPDGNRFLVIVPVQSSPVPLTLIQNWRALFGR